MEGQRRPLRPARLNVILSNVEKKRRLASEPVKSSPFLGACQEKNPRDCDRISARIQGAPKGAHSSRATVGATRKTRSKTNKIGEFANYRRLETPRSRHPKVKSGAALPAPWQHLINRNAESIEANIRRSRITAKPNYQRSELTGEAELSGEAE